MTQSSNSHIFDFINQTSWSLFEQPIRLRDIRAKAASIEAYIGNRWLERSVVGQIIGMVQHYYPLPEMIELYRRSQQVHRGHLERGDLDDSNNKNVLIADVYGLCERWLPDGERFGSRYPYGDVRLLRPIIGEVLIASADWERSPYPEQSALLGQWYEELAPEGSLYPSDEHLDYVTRFERFAEDIVWDSRDQEKPTIRNFPAPPVARPSTHRWYTQHILDNGPPRRY